MLMEIQGQKTVSDCKNSFRTFYIAVMYDAVERINITDNQNIEVVWKFDDLFATA